MEILNYSQYRSRVRMHQYRDAVKKTDSCPHEFAARCKRGIEARERLRRLPIPRHRALVVITERFDIRRAV